MKLNLKSALTGGAAVAALMTTSSANAGYYVGLFGGWSTMEDDFVVTTTTGSYSFTATFNSSLTSSWSIPGLDFGLHTSGSTQFGTASTTVGSRNSFDDGWVIGGAIGWDFMNGWRSELEVAYRSHDLDSQAGAVSSRYFYSRTFAGDYYFLNGTPLTGTYLFGTFTSSTNTTTISDTVGASAAEGDLETWSFMFNVWYDFDFGDSPIHPFIGGGIGFANASLDYDFSGAVTGLSTGNFGVLGTTQPFSYRGNGEATDWGFAYQLGAGLGYDFGNGMMLSAQYRYFNTGAMDLSLRDQAEVNLESHNFLVGLNIPLGNGM
jgi:opacity protein-like surface antigen